MKGKNKKGFSSRTLVWVLLLNILVIAGIYMFFGWFLNHTHFFLGENGKAVFSVRQVELCLLFSGIVNGFLDYIFLIKPLWELEEAVQEFVDLAEQNNWDKSKDITEQDSMDLVIKKLIRQQKIQKEKERIEEKQRQKAELYALQSQINPHFLYNALDSIRGYALLHDMEEISDITEALSRVFRNMISNKRELLPFAQEMDNIDNYMKIQQFRFNNKFQYISEIDEELLDKYMIPRMVLQPLVENAIMHGLERKTEGGWIKVFAYVTERRMVLTVTDNGAGISEERLEFLNQAMQMKTTEYKESDSCKHAGIALININQRIKLDFGSQYGIILSSTPNIRTSTEVVLPLLLKQK